MEPLLIYSPISLLDTNMAVASLSSDQKDQMYLSSMARGATAKQADPEDFLYFAFKLCHTGINNNKDIFLMEELKKLSSKGRGIEMPAWKTPEGEPIDNDHNFSFPAIVGDIYQSVLVENPTPEDDSRPYIKCAAVIYRGLYPDVAFKVARGSRLGYAKVSMEVKFKAGIPTQEGRILRGLNFKGAALTRIPADIDAHIDPVSAKASEVAQLATASEMVEITVGSKKMSVPASHVRQS